MQKGEFCHFHPLVNFIYFAAVIGFSMVSLNPVILIISLLCAVINFFGLCGAEKFKKSAVYIFFWGLIMAAVNPLFNHEGATIITYLPDGNPLTFESLVYGGFSAVMVVGVIVWFSCLTEVMTSDKLIYLFGNIIPSLALVFSMTLRFIPRLVKQTKKVKNAQKTLGNFAVENGVRGKIKNAISVMSSVITWSFENAVDTSNSMKARGYGAGKRTSFSLFKMSYRDVLCLFLIVILSAYILVAYVLKKMTFNYFPYIEKTELTPYTVSVYAVFLVLCLIPLIIEVCEVKKWKSLK